MYLDYFSIERHPFRITPDTSLFFSGGDQGRGVVLEAMLYAIQNGEGILKVVGEVGSGKTMLCRMLEERLPDTTEVVYLANPKLSPEEILYAIAFELKLPVRHETPRLLVMQQLQNHLLQQHAANCRVLITIEEAQSMPYETLEEIRLLSNLETNRDKLMQIILFGQPELDRILAARHIRQLRERITHSFYLHPLSRQEVAEYLRFRLGAAGCPCPGLLTAQAERLIARASGGLTRRVNILADKSLLAAYTDDALAVRGRLTAGMSPPIKRKHVLAAIGDSDYKIGLWDRLFTPMRLVGASLLLASGLLGTVMWQLEVDSAVQLQGAMLPLQQEQAAVVGDVVAVEPPAGRPPVPAPAALLSGPTGTFSEWWADSVDQLAVTGIGSAAVPAGFLVLDGKVSAAFNPAVSDSRRPAGVEAQAVVEESAAGNSEESPRPVAITGTDREPRRESLRQVHAAIPASSVLTRSRVQASNEWLRQADRGGFTVQFVTSQMENLDYAETMFQLLDNAGLIERAYLCVFKGQLEAFWTIKYGSFDRVESAQDFLADLPPSMREFRPFVQNMRDVVCNNNPGLLALTAEW